ncbi:M15 family metallopeptidase [Eubacterium xylanophilum]|uniref:M15 family metallopeptidase n=1 Tax=Eubacterium xylanophilum TaxID=39497 RepID=UPI0004BA6E61|nr:M15 family metallopeptidase [Eubacterium xylanophilum]
MKKILCKILVPILGITMILSTSSISSATSTDVTMIDAGTVLAPEKLTRKEEASYFKIFKITKKSDVYKRINGKSYKKNPYIKLSQLRYLKFVHYNYDHELQLGEMIVNKKIAKNAITILKKMMRSGYEIKSAFLIDNYWSKGGAQAADKASCEAGNTTSFCYRKTVKGSKISKHATGMAIDLNPIENPYLSKKNGKWFCSYKNGKPYVNRKKHRDHMISHKDKAFKLFKKYGFKWGGDWHSVKDYQHFEK